jgi:hypothetical protein
MGFAEFIIGPAGGRTRWLNPSYAQCRIARLRLTFHWRSRLNVPILLHEQ